MLTKPKNRTVAILLALSWTVIPKHIAGLHKFYLGQPLWGLVYILLSWTPIPWVASAIEAVWFLAQDREDFNQNFSLGELPVASPAIYGTSGIDPTKVSAIADALRQLDQLRQDGLISEYEFEQKRRQWLDRMA